MKLKVIWNEKFSITGMWEYEPGMEITVSEIKGLYLLRNPNFEEIKEKKEDISKEYVKKSYKKKK